MTFSFVMFFVWATALLMAIWAFNLAKRFGTRLQRRARQLPEVALPAVAVVVPIKGVDDDTSMNLRMLLEQEYPDYRMIFAVESNDDPVLSVLERFAIEDSRVEIVVAGLADSRGQKVHNQLAAIERTTDRDIVLAFMDADAKPGPGWLQALVTPLTYGEHIGATTGYRFYVPVASHTANKIVSVLNAQVASLLGPYRRTFAWGGSMAIRRRDFFGYGLAQMWQHAMSDDFVLSHCVKKVARRKIQFVSQCLVASDANFNWASLFEFAVRQYRITKVCAPLVWVTAVCGALLYVAAFSYTLFNVVYGFINPAAFSGSHEHLIQIAMFSLLYGLSMMRGWLLVLGGERLFPEHAPAVRSAIWWATVGMPWCFVVNLLALLGSAFGRTVVWRGVAYQMLSRTKTLVQRPHLASGNGGVGLRAKQIEVVKMDR